MTRLKQIRWGIIGLGKIADKFAADLLISKNAILQAIASRSIEKAELFGDKFGVDKRYGSYNELASSPEVDVIYVATPHIFHFEITMMCLKHGKAVLCEKPLGMNRDEVAAMLNEARQRKLFLMEGLWTRFIPATEKALGLLRANAIGEVKFMRADFGFKADGDRESRINDKKLGAGSLLDIGIYPIYLSLLTLGAPRFVKAMARMTDTGFDSYCSMLFDYGNAAKASLESTIEANTPVEAFIYGSKGAIKIHRPFHHSKKISLHQNGELKEVFDLSYPGHGYVFEIEEVNHCLKKRLTESPKLPHSTSLELISLMDKVREEIGLNYENRR